jgi:hypothetical protein
MSKLLLLLSLATGACVLYAQPAPVYVQHHRHNVVYVDGVSYVDRGVAYGPAPADTVIPTDDPPVGQLTPPPAE